MKKKIEIVNDQSVRICPSCGSNQIGCVDSRYPDGIVIRWRKCMKCKYRYKTAEFIIKEEK